MKISWKKKLFSWYGSNKDIKTLGDDSLVNYIKKRKPYGVIVVIVPMWNNYKSSKEMVFLLTQSIQDLWKLIFELFQWVLC